MSSRDSAPVHNHGRGSIRAFVREQPVHPDSICIVAMSIISEVISKPDVPIMTSKSLNSPLLVGEFLPPFCSVVVTRLILLLCRLNNR